MVVAIFRCELGALSTSLVSVFLAKVNSDIMFNVFEFFFFFLKTTTVVKGSNNYIKLKANKFLLLLGYIT